MKHILKATSKGQITLPAKWRKNFDTNQYLVKEKGGKLEISPIAIDDLDDTDEWVTIFSAECDNDGKPIPAEDVLQILEELE